MTNADFNIPHVCKTNRHDITRYLICIGISYCLLLLIVFQVQAQNYPNGFSQVIVGEKLSNPTAMAFAPDGRIFITEQAGGLRIIKNGTLQKSPFLALEVNSLAERGLLGIALDPNFTKNKYIYLYYTVPDATYHRVSRFTANGDTVLAGSEQLILKLDPIMAVNHNGGALHFGKDGKLYIGTGDNAVPANSQNLDSYHGKILRINPDGSVPDDNPFKGGSEQRKRVWAYGMRNPFTFDIQAGTGRIFVNDVGQTAWEEINDVTEGGNNYGWPLKEGYTADPAYTNPVFAYGHGEGDGKGCSIIGGVFFNPPTTNYPDKYKGKYFYSDFCNQWINFIDTDGDHTRYPFATNVAFEQVNLEVGPDGNLYFLTRKADYLYRIIYTEDASPAITDQPDNITVSKGQNAVFNVTASGSGLSFQWKKNGNIITGATSATLTIANAQPTDAGVYRVVVSNDAGSVTSNAAVLTVTSFNAAPIATITTPAIGTLYKAGQSISFSGNGVDAEDGVLPASAFSWEVEFHHDIHSHDGPPVAVGVKNGSFVIPTTGETSANVWYRLYLEVKDEEGLKHKIYRDIYPRKSILSFSTEPAGLQIALDGQPKNTPISVASVEGIIRTIGVEPGQKLNNIEYEFDHWVHGGKVDQIIETPEANAAYKAVFKPVNLRNPENPSGTVSGIDYKYYEGQWNELPDFNAIPAIKSGNLSTFDLSPVAGETQYGFQYTGYVNVPDNGLYTFYTSSDDGSQLYIGNTLVVDNDGVHSEQERSGDIGLKAGKHTITVLFFQRGGGSVLDISYAGPGLVKQLIPASALFRKKTITQPGDFAVKVVFQPLASALPAGYKGDHGHIFADRGNGYAYGWDAPTYDTRDRNREEITDVRYERLNHMQKEANVDAVWEIAVPNGTYQLLLVSSDPDFSNQINTFNVEGKIVADTDGYDNVDEYNLTVNVNDGKLTIRPWAGSQNAKISFVNIAQVNTAARIDTRNIVTEKVNVFPNPAKDVLNLSFNSAQTEKVQISITDVLSRTVYATSQVTSAGVNNMMIKTDKLPGGTYLLHIQIGKANIVRRITLTK